MLDSLDDIHCLEEAPITEEKELILSVLHDDQLHILLEVSSSSSHSGTSANLHRSTKTYEKQGVVSLDHRPPFHFYWSWPGNDAGTSRVSFDLRHSHPEIKHS